MSDNFVVSNFHCRERVFINDRCTEEGCGLESESGNYIYRQREKFHDILDNWNGSVDCGKQLEKVPGH